MMERLLKKWASPGSFSAEEMEDIISVLKEEKFIDDFRFARAFVNDKLKFSGWGAVKIRYNLRRSGVSEEAAERALSEIYYSGADRNMSVTSEELLHKLLKNKWKSLSGENDMGKKKARVIRFALGRGFGMDEISAQFEKYDFN
jgi:regulatory protein